MLTPCSQRGAQKAVNAVVEALHKMSKPVKATDRESIAKVASIAGNNNPEIGEILADALMKVGKDGVITVEEGRHVNTEVETGRRHAVRPWLPVSSLHHR